MKCAIITPIGPGHAELFQTSCLPSIERATAFGAGPFDEVVLFPMDDTEGRHGRSNRRNAAIAEAQKAGVEWLFFLDADDEITPNAFVTFGKILEENPGIDAAFGLICNRGAKGKPAIREDQIENLDSYDDLLGQDPFFSLIICHFVRTEIAASLGFDEQMDAGEDFDYYFRLWKSHSCVKRPEIFAVVRRGAQSQGLRSATGRDWNLVVGPLWAAKVAEHPIKRSITSSEKTAVMQVGNPLDLFQGSHLGGTFHDAASLNMVGRILEPGARIVDVGAGSGNDAIWYAQNLEPSSIVLIEPDPAVLPHLEINLAANVADDILDRRGLGQVISTRPGRYRIDRDPQDLRQQAHPTAHPMGPIMGVGLDSLIGEDRVDLLQIGAEHMALDILKSANAIIVRDRPLLRIRILRGEITRFAQQWLLKYDYNLVFSTAEPEAMTYVALADEKEGMLR